ncbi:MAG: type III secretion system inner rod subunit SctI [Plesiomonas sp.]|uniref:type III secretion system inner rod subunit SctI n=1 Tax=Plesiomonas sp. TaxID=2486279 RepID=UPI003F3ED5A7
MAIHAINTALNATSSLTSSFITPALSSHQIKSSPIDIALQKQFTQLLHSSNTSPERNTLTVAPTSDPQVYLNMQENLAKSTVEFDLIAKTAGSITQSINKLANMQ